MYDFLYADHEKVASLLSQLEGSGTPKEMAVRAQRAKDTKEGVAAKFAGSGAEFGSARGLQYEVRQTYDPLWVNSRKLIEHVSKNGTPSDKLAIGQVRIFDGDLMAFDQSILPKLMGAGSMRDMIAAGMNSNSGPDKSNHKKNLHDNRKEAEIIQTYIASLALSIQFVLMSLGTGFWFNINRDYLYLHETDVPLKYPIIVSGKWKILGIIDAMPHDQFAISHLDEQEADKHMPAMLTHLAQLIGSTAIIFGRRIDSYGLKPLAIYREITIPA